MADPIKPAGGFQQGGWYEGRQYWDGTFSEPGQINALSNQQGAGQMVSAPVIAASNPAQGLAPGTNEAYLAAQRAKMGLNPSVPGAVTPGATAPGAANAITTEYDKQLIDKQAEITKLMNEAAEQKAMISENPFLSEASLVGRIAKIDKKANDRLAVLNTQLKFIQDQIAASQPEIQLIESTDNAGNVTVTSVNKKTGAIVGTNSLGAVGKTTKTSTTKKTSEKSEEDMSDAEIKKVNSDNLIADAQEGATLRQLWEAYGKSGALTAAEILKLYKENTKYDEPEETVKDILNGNFKDV